MRSRPPRPATSGPSVPLPSLACPFASCCCPWPASPRSRWRRPPPTPRPPVIGYGDQRPEMFSDPLFAQLKVPRQPDRRRVGRSSPRPRRRSSTRGWPPRAPRVAPLVAIEHSWTPGRAKLAPTAAQYSTLVRTLRQRYPFVRNYSPWNEANHSSQPTARNPKLAATYWRLMRQACSGCRHEPSVPRPQGRGGRPALAGRVQEGDRRRVQRWAVHGYGELNRGTDKSLSRLLRSCRARCGSPRPRAGSRSAAPAGSTTRRAPPRRSIHVQARRHQVPLEDHALVLLPVARRAEGLALGQRRRRSHGQPPPGLRGARARPRVALPPARAPHSRSSSATACSGGGSAAASSRSRVAAAR